MPTPEGDPGAGPGAREGEGGRPAGVRKRAGGKRTRHPGAGSVTRPDVDFERPRTVLIGALGGEGGGVLSGWLVRAAEEAGHWVQASSVPGVAQRTGATTYYLEIAPRRPGEETRPVMALLPTPGQVDLVVASELLEAGRALQNGMVTPERTTLIASTHRFYAVAEKAAMGDGRFPGERIIEGARALSARAILADLARVTEEARTVVSSVLLGAIGGSGVLPVPREAYERAITEGGIAVEANLRGFRAGWELAERGGEEPPPAVLVAPPAPSPAPAREAGNRPPLPAGLEEAAAALGPALEPIVREALPRLVEWQDETHARSYLERLSRLARAGGEGEGAVLGEAARTLALWMSYEDIIRVADLKSRPERLARIRAEARAGPEALVRVVEYFRPGPDEWAALLPPAPARWLRRVTGANRDPDRFSFGVHLRTTSLTGWLLLRLLAAARRWRRRSERYLLEEQAIERWLGELVRCLEAGESELARELARLPGVRKGYGETHARGVGSYERILASLPRCRLAGEPAAALRGLREAALADPRGEALERALGALPGEDAS